MWTVYILKSMEKLIYVGMTQDVTKRLEEHNSGKSYYTKRGTNRKMVYSETFDSSEEARKREKYFKSGFGRRFLRNRVKTYLNEVC